MNPELRGDVQARVDEGTRDRIRALPGSLTYLDLIRQNRRASAVLMVVMVVVAVVIGGTVAAVVAARAGAVDNARDLLPSVIVGGVVALFAALIGTTWSWF